jgi:BirA family biotin operon repressor/biotin-[acetyl-CoA-carboxylase] ligase
VVGIGINVSVEPEEFPEGLRWPAISVKRGASVQQLRLALNSTLTEWLRAPHSGALAAYRSRDALSGREVEWTRSEASAALAGTAAGIDDAGNLTLRGPDGILTVSSGEVQLRAAQSEASKG